MNFGADTPRPAATEAAPQPPVASAAEAPRTGVLKGLWQRTVNRLAPRISPAPEAAQATASTAGSEQPTGDLGAEAAAGQAASEAAGQQNPQARPTLGETVRQSWQDTRDAAAQYGQQAREAIQGGVDAAQTALHDTYVGDDGRVKVGTVAKHVGAGLVAGYLGYLGASAAVNRGRSEVSSTDAEAPGSEETAAGTENAEAPEAPTFEQMAIRQLAHMLNRIGARDVTEADLNYRLSQTQRILGDTGEQISETASQLGQTVRENAQKVGEVVVDQVINPKYKNRNAVAAAALFRYGIPAMSSAAQHIRARNEARARAEEARPDEATPATDADVAATRANQAAANAAPIGLPQPATDETLDTLFPRGPQAADENTLDALFPPQTPHAPSEE